jgi:NAD(P)-dependent dehydrogenase (short-subunit alcohol dehydrogenase family)
MNKPVLLVTGGLTGIGRAAAVAFAKRGAKVVVAGRRGRRESSSSLWGYST